MKSLKTYLLKYKKEVLVAPVFKFFETLTDIINPILVALMIDVGVASNNINYIFAIGAVVLTINIPPFYVVCFSIIYTKKVKYSLTNF